MYFLNPDASTVTVYLPGKILGKLYVPAEVVAIFVETPVSLLIAVTCAFATEAPAGSRTWPLSVPVVPWANADTEKNSAVAIASSARTTPLGRWAAFRQGPAKVLPSLFIASLRLNDESTRHNFWRFESSEPKSRPKRDHSA